MKATFAIFPLLLLAAYSHAQYEPVEPTHKVTLPMAHKGTLEVDTLLLDSYGTLPDDLRGFYLDARKHLIDSPGATPSSAEVVQAASSRGLPLMSGPMLGDLKTDSVCIWMRPVTDTLSLRLKDSAQSNIPVSNTSPGASTTVQLKGLQAGSGYLYEVIDANKTVIAEGRFHTAPDKDTQDRFRIAFGSDCHKIGFHNPNLMHWIVTRGNRAMMMLGDNAVDDREDHLHQHYSDYLLRDVSKAWRDLSANVPIYAGWDDHDYLNNDKSGIPKNSGEAGRSALRRLWQENWNNPPTDVADRGIYFSTSVGPIDIIMLDTRSCREGDRRGEHGSYLGEVQLAWLKKTLKASTAKFILLSSGTMWSDNISNGKDSWGTWDKEGREEIFKWIEDNQIGGVILLSGDRHGARGITIPRASGFTFYEFEAGTLGGCPGPGPFGPDRSTQLFGYGGGTIAYGEFEFDFAPADPTVTFRLINQEGQAMEEHLLTRTQLTPGK